MSRNIWVISDTHFGHENILRFKDKEGKIIRDFPSYQDMDEFMIDKWNSVVLPQDKVYHLGDVALQYGKGRDRFEYIMKNLNGHKRLVVGNHDDLKFDLLGKYFEKIYMWRMWPEHNLLLSHVPVHPSTLGESRFNSKQMINVHGHIHTNPSPEGPYKCVCVDQPGVNYVPINIEDLKDG